MKTTLRKNVIIPYFQQALQHLKRGGSMKNLEPYILSKLSPDQSEELIKYERITMIIREEDQVFSNLDKRLHEVSFVVSKNLKEISKDPISSEVRTIFKSNKQLKKFCL